MEWSDVGKYVGKTTSILGGILGGPIGVGVEEVGALIAGALGVETTPSEVLKCLQNDPEALVKLKELEVKEKDQLLQIRLAQIQTELADRTSARESAVAAGVYDKTIYISLFVIFLAVGLEAAVLFFGGHITISPEIVGRVLGTYDTLGMSAAYYIWGSNKEARQNAYMLYKSTPNDKR